MYMYNLSVGRRKHCIFGFFWWEANTWLLFLLSPLFVQIIMWWSNNNLYLAEAAFGIGEHKYLVGPFVHLQTPCPTPIIE